MKKNVKKINYLFLSLFIILASCSTDGDPGPAGKDGTNGTNGVDGATGTANVIYSPQVTVKKADWSVFSGGTFLVADINEPEITQDIFDKGVVLVYRYSAGDGGAYQAFPFSAGGDYNSLIRLGIVRIMISNAIFPATDRIFRYVIIPGGTPTGGRQGVSSQQAIYNELAAAGVDINDYDQVTAYYNILD